MDRSFLDKFNIDFHLTVGVSAWYSVTLKNVRVRLVFVHSSVKLLNLANGSGHVTEFWRDTIMCRKQQRHFDTILELALLNSIVLLHVFIESKEIAFHRLLGPYTVLPKSDPPEIWELLSKTLDWVWKKATFFFWWGGGVMSPLSNERSLKRSMILYPDTIMNGDWLIADLAVLIFYSVHAAGRGKKSPFYSSKKTSSFFFLVAVPWDSTIIKGHNSWPFYLYKTLLCLSLGLHF